MAMNPNYVPWMTILGLGGAGIGYAIGGGGTGPEATLPALYGLVGGSLAGIVVHIILRRRSIQKASSAKQPEEPGQSTD